jgi:HEPN domain-containing protein
MPRGRKLLCLGFLRTAVSRKISKRIPYSKGFRAIITHSVVDLLFEAAKFEKTFEKLVDLGKELDKHYIGSRYPNFYPSGAPYRYYTRGDAERCISYAESILREVRKFFPG